MCMLKLSIQHRVSSRRVIMEALDSQVATSARGLPPSQQRRYGYQTTRPTGSSMKCPARDFPGQSLHGPIVSDPHVPASSRAASGLEWGIKPFSRDLSRFPIFPA